MAKEKTTTKAKHKKSASKAAVSKKSVSTAKVTAAPAPSASVAPAPAVKAPKAKKLAMTGPLATLYKWNKWLAIVFLLQGLAIVLLGSDKVTAPVMVQYPAVDTLASEISGRQIIGSANHHLLNVKLIWITAIFLIVFSAVSLLASLAYRRRYEQDITRGTNDLRWLGLGLGGGTMVLTLALVGGMTQLTALVLLFTSVFGGCMLALAAERVVALNNGIKTRFAHLLCAMAVVGIALPWVVFATGVVGALLWNGHLPGYLYGVYAAQALLAVGFVLATHFRLSRQGKWADDLYTERGYLLLTFISATLLTWQLYVGVLQP